MATETITTKEPGSNRELVTEYNFGDSLQEAVDLFGEDAVLAGFKSDARVGLQAKVRGMLKATEEDSEAAKYTDEQILEAVKEWKPGTKTRAASDPLAKLQALLEKISPEQRAALLEKALG